MKRETIMRYYFIYYQVSVVVMLSGWNHLTLVTCPSIYTLGFHMRMNFAVLERQYSDYDLVTTYDVHVHIQK